jgi:hypothetical protein
MLPLSLAQQLKDAGLSWTPHPRDFFAIPDRGMDDQIFVLNFMLVGIGMVGGQPVVTFHGTVEHPIDFLYLNEAVWIPAEDQLRTHLEERLIAETQPAFQLTSTPDGYRCQINFRGASLAFEAFGVAEAYGQALLHVLETN